MLTHYVCAHLMCEEMLTVTKSYLSLIDCIQTSTVMRTMRVNIHVGE